ncbi:MAG: hypothetical protein KC777_29250 [Cyanobacteria bacterium HKST-UBA02]|nr:hypothetical protein [Cyanobacteria bacterium HKST-UBA02]
MKIAKQLSDSDMEYYSRVEHWGGGPCYEAKFVFQPVVSKTDVFTVAEGFLDLIPWEIERPTRNSILFLPESEATVGVSSSAFSSADRVVVPFLQYQVFIRPCQFERLTGRHPEDDLRGCIEEPLSELVNLFITLGQKLKDDFPQLKFLTIDREDNGYISPRIHDATEGIYISQQLVDALQLEAEPVFQERHMRLSFPMDCVARKPPSEGDCWIDVCLQYADATQMI